MLKSDQKEFSASDVPRFSHKFVARPNHFLPNPWQKTHKVIIPTTDLNQDLDYLVSNEWLCIPHRLHSLWQWGLLKTITFTSLFPPHMTWILTSGITNLGKKTLWIWNISRHARECHGSFFYRTVIWILMHYGSARCLLALWYIFQAVKYHTTPQVKVMVIEAWYYICSIQNTYMYTLIRFNSLGTNQVSIILPLGDQPGFRNFLFFALLCLEASRCHKHCSNHFGLLENFVQNCLKF
jgi:hypothetical protein